MLYNAKEAKTFMVEAKCELVTVYIFIVHYHKIAWLLS